MQAIVVELAFDFWERDWLDELFDSVAVRYVGPDEADRSRPTVVIFSDSNGQHAGRVSTLLNAFRQAGTAVGVIHLGDEYCRCPVDYYGQANIIFRNYFRPSIPRTHPIIHFPLGYKREFKHYLRNRPIVGRGLNWFFAGEPKGSRVEMLEAARQVPNGRSVSTRCWQDPGGLSTRDYAAALNDTVFALCPRGNDSVDCFRVYEALEAGAIPIVEDDGRFDALMRKFAVPATIRNWQAPRRIRERYRSRFGPSYWLSMYGDDCPLPRLARWDDLPRVVSEIDIVQTDKIVRQWWKSLKGRVKNQFASGIAGLSKPFREDHLAT